MGKILLIDIDGTLVDYENRLPASAVDAIRKARANGHKVYLCSGRSKAENKQEIWNIGIDGYIGGNGSYVESDGVVVMHQLITADQCRRIVDWLNARGLEFYLESNNGLFASRTFKDVAVRIMAEYSRRKGRDARTDISYQEAFPGMIWDGELYRDDLNKISYVLHSYQDALDAQKAFPEMQHGTWGGAGETALFGDMGVKNITKAHAVETLLAANPISNQFEIAAMNIEYDFGIQADDITSYKGVKSNDNGDAGLVLVIQAAAGKAQNVVDALTTYQKDQVAFYGNYAEFAQAQSNVENAVIGSNDSDLVVMVIASNECSADLSSAVDSVLGK